MGEILNAKIKEMGLVDQYNISGFTDNSHLDKKIEVYGSLKETNKI